MPTNLFIECIRARDGASAARAARVGSRPAPRRAAAPPVDPAPVTVRLATPGDAVALARVAELDSAPTPRRPLLVGERGGRLVAALSLADGTAIADPFVLTDDVVALLRMRARQLGEEDRRSRRALAARRQRRAANA